MPGFETDKSAEATPRAKAWLCSLYLLVMGFMRIPGPRCYQLAAKLQEKGDHTSHAAGFPRSWWPSASLCPVLGRLAFVHPVRLRRSVLPKAGGHRFDEIVLVHEPKHAFLARRDKAVTAKPSGPSTDQH